MGVLGPIAVVVEAFVEEPEVRPSGGFHVFVEAADVGDEVVIFADV